MDDGAGEVVQQGAGDVFMPRHVAAQDKRVLARPWQIVTGLDHHRLARHGDQGLGLRIRVRAEAHACPCDGDNDFHGIAGEKPGDAIFCSNAEGRAF